MYIMYRMLRVDQQPQLSEGSVVGTLWPCSCWCQATVGGFSGLDEEEGFTSNIWGWGVKTKNRPDKCCVNPFC